MRIVSTRNTASAVLCAILMSGIANAQTAQRSPGDEAFAAGNFDAAASAYTTALATNPDDANAELGIGTIELYRNHIADARKNLERAVFLDPGSLVARTRLNSIVKRTGGPEDYHITFTVPKARIPLVAIDPLPTFKAKINGMPVTLLIDTGGPHIDLSASAIKRLRLTTRAAGTGIFAGGLRAQIRSVRIERFEVPGVTVKGIPGGLMPGQAPFPGVDGVVGTDFLSHFLSTIDYAHRMLLLRPVEDSAAFLVSASAAGATMVPMWLAADHLILTHAHVNAAPDGLYLIDTGGPGIGVDLRKSTLNAAGITPDAAHPDSMLGGGGRTQVLRFTASGVTIGKLTRHNVPGVYLPSEGFDKLFPFAVAGTISHEFFRHTSVAFDFASMTLVITPY